MLRTQGVLVKAFFISLTAHKDEFLHVPLSHDTSYYFRHLFISSLLSRNGCNTLDGPPMPTRCRIRILFLVINLFPPILYIPARSHSFLCLLGSSH